MKTLILCDRESERYNDLRSKVQATMQEMWVCNLNCVIR